MNIIICGAGRVGFTIAKLLSDQNHSITINYNPQFNINNINIDTLNIFFKVNTIAPLILSIWAPILALSFFIFNDCFSLHFYNEHS